MVAAGGISFSAFSVRRLADWLFGMLGLCRGGGIIGSILVAFVAP